MWTPVPGSALLAAAVGAAPAVVEADGADDGEAALHAAGGNDDQEAVPPCDAATLATVVAGAESGEARKHSEQ